MRRTTLGPLSSADLNSSLDTSVLSVGDGRKSLGTSGLGKLFAGKPAGPGSAKKQVTHRQSLAPGGGAAPDPRRASIAAPLLAKKKDVDARPLNTRKWQELETEALLAFLEACGYNQHLTKQTVLQGLNTKDFSQIFNFLLRGFDTSFVINGKVESEVTDVIKALHYPFPPSKTALSAIGASHSWPAFLGLLSWLRELLQYDRAVQQWDMQQDAAVQGVPGSPAHFWGYLQVAYTHYLAGADEEIATTEDAISSQFDAVQGAEEAEEAAMQEGMRHLLSQLQALQAQKTTLPAVRAQARDLAADVAALESGMGKVEDYGVEMARKVETKARAVVEGEREVGRLRDEMDRLTAAVANQELSQEDVRRLRSEASALRAEGESVGHRKSGVARRIEELKGELRGALGGLDTNLRDYHEGARQLQMIPKGSKYSMGADFTLRLEEGALAKCAAWEVVSGGAPLDVRGVAYALLGGADMKHGIKEKIRYLKSLLVKKATESRSAIMTTSDACSELAHARDTVFKTMDEVTTGASAAEEATRREAEALEARLRDGSAELSRAQGSKAHKRADAQAAVSSRAELSPAVLVELEASIEHMAAAQAGERARLSDAVSRLVMRVEEHRRAVASKLTHCAVNAIAFKDGMRLAEAERAARLASPIALTATPAAATASLNAGASILLAQSMGLGSSYSAASGLYGRDGSASLVGLSSSLLAPSFGLPPTASRHGASLGGGGVGGYGGGAAVPPPSHASSSSATPARGESRRRSRAMLSPAAESSLTSPAATAKSRHRAEGTTPSRDAFSQPTGGGGGGGGMQGLSMQQL